MTCQACCTLTRAVTWRVCTPSLCRSTWHAVPNPRRRWEKLKNSRASCKTRVSRQVKRRSTWITPNRPVSALIFIMCDRCNALAPTVHRRWVTLCILRWHGRGRVTIAARVMFPILYGNRCRPLRGKFVTCRLTFTNKNAVTMLK